NHRSQRLSPIQVRSERLPRLRLAVFLHNGAKASAGYHTTRLAGLSGPGRRFTAHTARQSHLQKTKGNSRTLVRRRQAPPRTPLRSLPRTKTRRVPVSHRRSSPEYQENRPGNDPRKPPGTRLTRNEDLSPHPKPEIEQCYSTNNKPRRKTTGFVSSLR